MFQRIKNLWALSAYQVPKDEDIGKKYSDLPAGTKVVTALVKPPKQQKAVFIPRTKLTPIQELNKDEN